MWRVESEEGLPLRLKVKINSREHFTVPGYKPFKFEMVSRWHTGTATISTYGIGGLLGTKLRALYQRKKVGICSGTGILRRKRLYNVPPISQHDVSCRDSKGWFPVASTPIYRVKHAIIRKYVVTQIPVRTAVQPEFDVVPQPLQELHDVGHQNRRAPYPGLPVASGQARLSGAAYWSK